MKDTNLQFSLNKADSINDELPTKSLKDDYVSLDQSLDYSKIRIKFDPRLRDWQIKSSENVQVLENTRFTKMANFSRKGRTLLIPPVDSTLGNALFTSTLDG